jgi:arginase
VKVRVIGVPSAWGTKELGARRTPGLLREAGLLDWLAAPGLQVEDGGDVPVPPQTEDDLWEARAAALAERGDRTAGGTAAVSAPGGRAAADGAGRRPRPDPDLVHLDEVVAMATAVREAVAASLRDGALPLLIGGECCLSIGVGAALAERGPVATVWLDAHGDLNTPETSPSGLITGMPFAAYLGHGHPALLAVGEGAPRPAPEHAWLLGGRDLDPGEDTNLASFGLHHLTLDEVVAAGPEAAAAEILALPEAAMMPPEARATAREVELRPALLWSRVYLHFDVDALDPEHAPGVHYRVPGGFQTPDVATLAGYLCASGRVGAMAVASANLDHDRDGRTVAAIREVLVSIADALSLAG